MAQSGVTGVTHWNGEQPKLKLWQRAQCAKNQLNQAFGIDAWLSAHCWHGT
jgi:hypothetical protein